VGFIQKWIHSLNVPVDEATGAIRVTGIEFDKDIDIGDINLLNMAGDKINPATAEGLAAILAKLSADPATQATLAAVLAKLSSDPATQTTLAAVLSALGSPAQATEADAAADLIITALGSPAQAGEADSAADLIITALGSPAQANEADSAADLIITALGSPAQAAEADAAADLIVTALGSPAQAGETATAADTIMGGEGGQSLAGVVTALGSPAQAGEADSAADLIITALGSPMQTGEVDVSGLALESGGVLDDILTALGATGTLPQTGEFATALAGATAFDIRALDGTSDSVNIYGFDSSVMAPMSLTVDKCGAGIDGVLRTALYARIPAWPGGVCEPLTASNIDPLEMTLALNITEHLLAPVMGDYHAATGSQVDFGGPTGYAKNVELFALEPTLGSSYRLTCTSTDDMIHFDNRVALNVIPMTFNPGFVTHSKMQNNGFGELSVADATVRDGNSASNTYAQLTAPGDAAAYTLTFHAKDSGFTATVGTINTNVVVKFQGSMDGANYFDLLTTDASTGTAAIQHTITGNGTTQYTLFGNSLLTNVKPVFVSEAGGTDATVDFASMHVR